MASLKIIKSTHPSDFGLRIARISESLMKKFDYLEDEIIEVIGNKRTGVRIRALMSNGSDKDLTDNQIMLDGLTRSSLGASVDSIVRIDKTSSLPAKSVSIVPLNPTVSAKNIPMSHFNVLKDVPVSVFDIIALKSSDLAGIDLGDETDLFIEQPGSMEESATTGEAESILGEFRFIVKTTEPSGIVVIDENTKFSLEETIDKEAPMFPSGSLRYEDIGGYDSILKRLHELVVIPLRNPELFKSLNIEFPKGVLITGPSGAGKTLFAKIVANESGAYVVNMKASEIVSGQFGEAEKRIKKYFREASVHKPAIIIVDDINTVAPERNPMTTTELSRRLTAEFLDQIDKIPRDDPIMLIATSNNPSQLDQGFKRPGRFDHEISLSPPDKNEREEILLVKTRGVPIESDVNIEELAERTRGYSGADLNMLVKESALSALRRILPQLEGTTIPMSVMTTLTLKHSDFNEALKFINPSAMKEIFTAVPDVSWQDVGGLEQVKQEIRESVQLPLKNPEIFVEMGVKPPSGVLLFGPPGTGKTLLAKAIANETSANFIAIKGPELNSKWFGETERAIREVFRKARMVAPCVIFFDEIDSMIRIRGSSNAEPWMDRMINQFLTEMDGLDKKGQVIVVGATNRPELLDPAILRPGRFDRLIYVPTPDQEARKEILKVHTKNMKLEEDVNLSELVNKMEYFVGADIENLCREAAMMALREDNKARKVGHQHFLTALSKSQPTMNKKTVEYFDELSNNLRGNVNRRDSQNYRDYFS